MKKNYTFILSFLIGSIWFSLGTTAKAQYTLQLLHASDLEGSVEAIDKAPNFAAIIDTLENQHANTLIISSGDNFIPGPFFLAANEPVVRDSLRAIYSDFYGVPLNNLTQASGRIDISIMNFIGFDASALGNHDFDAGTSALRNIIAPSVSGGNITWPGANFPYLSANLNFSGNSDLSSRAINFIQPVDSFRYDVNNVTKTSNAKKIAPATVIEKGGELIGIVGATTQILTTISSPGTVQETTGGQNNMVALAAAIQPIVDSLTAMGVNKIIVSTHLQQFALEQQLIGLLNNVDIIIAGGSDYLLANPGNVLNPGDVAAGTYPFVTTNANSQPAVIVSTDGTYSYVGRLVVNFDANGVIVPTSINPAESGAYATQDAVVSTLWGNLTAPFAAGTKGYFVKRLTNSIINIVSAKDGVVVGYSSVYLEGRRNQVRSEETQLGNLSADANLWFAKFVDPTVAVSIKNGGGIRAEIGQIVVNDQTGATSFNPPPANILAGKPQNGISQLEVENAFRFNNGISIVHSTAAGLKELMEHGFSAVTPTSTPGSFPQIGGMHVSFDYNKPANERIRSLVIVDENGNHLDTIVRAGAVFGDPTRSIKIATLGFLATGGDGYPFPQVSTQIVSVDSATLSGKTFNNNFNFSVLGGEQDAFAEYMNQFYGSNANAFNNAETPKADDIRIQLLNVRTDDILPQSYSLLSPLNEGEANLSGDENQSLTITWSANVQGTSNYTWILINAFTGMPVIQIPTGTDTSLTLSFAAIDQLMEANNVPETESAFMLWEVTATAGGQVYASDNGPFFFVINRGIVTRAFSPIAPANAAAVTIEGDQNTPVAISWESARSARGLGDEFIDYTWELDAESGNFSSPIVQIAAGTDTTLSLTFDAINTLLAANGIENGTTLNAKWRIVATTVDSNEVISNSFTLDLTRGVMTGEEMLSKSNIKLFPNPSNGNIQINHAGFQFQNFELFDYQGKSILNGNLIGEQHHLDFSSLTSGFYFIKLVGTATHILPLQIIK